MGRPLSRGQCPKCLDSGRDNLIEYDDGKYCFACGYSDKKREVMLDMINNGTCVGIPNRCLSLETCERWHYQVGTWNGQPVHIANFRDEYNNLVAQNIRMRDKQMRWLGDAKKAGLFGMDLWPPNNNLPIIVVEGFIDAMSVYEVMGSSYPVVSIITGAGGQAKDGIRKHLEYLSKFKAVYLGLDNDEAGRESTSDMVDLFEPGFVKVIKWTKKDPNEMLTGGQGNEIRGCIHRAQEVRPDTIVSVEDILEETLIKPEIGISWPWKTLTDKTYGIHPHQIYTIGAGSGIGKTEFLKDIMLHLAFHHEEKVGAMFLEQKPSQTLLRLAGGVLGKRLHVPGDYWDEEEIKKSAMLLKDKVYFYDHFGGQNIDSVMHKIRYFVKGLDVKYVILDHLTALAADMKDERKGIDMAMARLGSLVQELECTFFIVSHLAKPMEGISYEEGRHVNASAFRGSQSIQYWSSFMIGLERNKLAVQEFDRTVTTVRILKDRFSGEADGVNFPIIYNRNTGKLEEFEV